MYTRLARGRQRRGATIVETAFVIGIALLLLLGLFEFARFVMMNQMVESAAREGARLAVVHTADMTESDVKNEVRRRLVGLEKNLEDMTIDVYGVVLRNGAKNQKLSTWTDAKITDGIVVEITGRFRPVLPTFFKMPETFTVHTKAVMYSEAN